MKTIRICSKYLLFYTLSLALLLSLTTAINFVIHTNAFAQERSLRQQPILLDDDVDEHSDATSQKMKRKKAAPMRSKARVKSKSRSIRTSKTAGAVKLLDSPPAMKATSAPKSAHSTLPNTAPTPPAPTVEMANTPAHFKILLIEASRSTSPSVSKKLSHISNELISGFSQYNHFTLLNKVNLQVLPTLATTIKLPDLANSSMSLQVYPVADKHTRELTLTINNTQASQLKTYINSTFFQAGLPTENGILIVAITLIQ